MRMNPILDMVLNASGGAATRQIGEQFGLSGDQTASALGQLVPALLAGLQKNTSQEGGMEALLGALGGGNHSRFLDNPELLGQEDTKTEGNAILGHILGGKDASRAIASQVAGETGIGAAVLKQLLPVAATMVMGSLAKTHAAPAAADSNGIAGLLGSFLDRNQDGSVADDVIGMLGKALGGR